MQEQCPVAGNAHPRAPKPRQAALALRVADDVSVVGFDSAQQITAEPKSSASAGAKAAHIPDKGCTQSLTDLATPAEVVNYLNKEVVAVLESAPVKARLAAQGFTPKPMTAEGFRSFITDETRKFGELIKTNHITID